MIQFLETITWLDNGVLIPVDRIKHIAFSYKTSWQIEIIADEGKSWIECFGDDEVEARNRYNQIKEILNVTE